MLQITRKQRSLQITLISFPVLRQKKGALVAMTEIKPFKAIVYNPKKICDFNQVVCPPYDVISPQAQDMYRERSCYNLIHVLLTKDTPGEDKYKRAQEIFNEWLKDDLLIRDNSEAIYFYSQEYNINREKRTRLGFISLLRLPDNKESGVFGHENTHLEAKEDRFRLIKLIKANLSPVFVIFLDKKRIIQRIFQKYVPKQDALIEVVDDEKTRHKLWRITDLELIKNIKQTMLNEDIFIADGHHRYEVACAYRDLMRKNLGIISGEEDFNYILSYFTNTDPRGLTILPIHRLLKLDRLFSLDELRLALSDKFDINEVKDKIRFFFLMQKAGFNEHLIGMYRDKRYWLLRLKNVKILDKLIADRPKEYRCLDVSILNRLVFKEVLGLDPENLKNIVYSCEPSDFLKEVDGDPFKIAFFLNPVKMEQIISVALNGNKMPPKSTYFYPKVLSGLVINKFEKV